jgi:CDP-diacylglycerol--serine O-phosphatidyltransferase
MHLLQRLKWSAPSALTIGALVSGLTAVRFAAEHDFERCVKCIFLACVLDGVDGAVARALGTSSEFGFELDSLCDLVNFGVAPALILHFWMETQKKDHPDASELDTSFTWFCCVAYASACVLRLARFNQEGKETKKAARKDSEKPPELSSMLQRALYFKGLPAPVGAAYALAPLTLSLSELPARLGHIGDEGAWAVGRSGAALVLLITASLMVSTIPTVSSKMLGARRGQAQAQAQAQRRKKRTPPPPGSKKREWFRYYRGRVLAQAFRSKKLVGGVVVLVACTSYPFETALAGIAVHALTIPIGVAIYFVVAPDDQYKDDQEDDDQQKDE